jgi:type II secretory pathway component GspD/PulD (secretin)
MILVALLICFCASHGLAQGGSQSPLTKEKLTDITFKDVDAREAIRNLGRQLKLNVVFDESVRIPGKLDLELKDITLEATLKIIFIQNRLRASWVEWNTIYVYTDNPVLRERFSEYPVWELKSGQHQ